jgi:4-amino-4-deoxy-L-arabinose transferase-like glycosyltransferase
MLIASLRRIESQHLWFWAIALAVLGIGLGLRSPWPPDEPRFALIARDMLLTGDWLIPRVAGDVYADKPPAFMWAIAGMTWLSGSLRVGFLLPSLLAAIGTLWMVKDLGTRFWDRRTGLVAAATLLVTMQFTTQARFAQIDMVLTLFTTLGFYGLTRHLLFGPDWRAYSLGCFAMGVGVITKAVGFLPLFVMPVFIWAAWRRWPGTETAWATRRDPRWFLGAVLFALPIGLWLVPMMLETGAGGAELATYRADLLFTQTVTRYLSAWHHLKPIWYYLVQVIPVLWLPVIAALPWLIPEWRRALTARDLRILLLLSYTILVVLFFSLSPGKRGVYLLPVLPAFVLAASPYLIEISKRVNAQRLAIGGLLFTALVPSTIIVLGLMRLIPWIEEDVLLEVEAAAKLLLICLVLSAALWLYLGRMRGAFLALAGWIATGWILTYLTLVPALDRTRSGERVMHAAEAALEHGQRLGLIAFLEQQILAAERPLIHFGHRRRDPHLQVLDGAAWLLSEPDNRLLVHREAMMECWDVGQSHVLVRAHWRDWYLVGAADITESCRVEAMAVGDWSARMVRYELSDTGG